MALVHVVAGRHEQTNSTKDAGSDFARTITEAGQTHAQSTGEVLENLALIPEIALCTSGVRTVQTAKAIAGWSLPVEIIRGGYPGQPDFDEVMASHINREYGARCKEHGHSDLSFKQLTKGSLNLQQWSIEYGGQLRAKIRSLAEEGVASILVIGHGPTAFGVLAPDTRDLPCPPGTTVILQIETDTMEIVSWEKIA